MKADQPDPPAPPRAAASCRGHASLNSRPVNALDRIAELTVILGHRMHECEGNIRKRRERHEPGRHAPPGAG